LTVVDITFVTEALEFREPRGASLAGNFHLSIKIVVSDSALITVIKITSETLSLELLEPF